MPESPRLQENALKCTIIGLFKAFANTGEATGREKAGLGKKEVLPAQWKVLNISQLQVKRGTDK